MHVTVMPATIHANDVLIRSNVYLRIIFFWCLPTNGEIQLVDYTHDNPVDKATIASVAHGWCSNTPSVFIDFTFIMQLEYDSSLRWVVAYFFHTLTVLQFLALVLLPNSRQVLFHIFLRKQMKTITQLLQEYGLNS